MGDTRRRADPAVTAALLLEAVPPLVRLLRSALQSGTGAVTLTQARILARLEAGPRLIGELATAMEVRAPTASVAVDNLVRRGLVTRLADEADRRQVLVALTADGTRALSGARHSQMQAVAALLGRLDERELRALETGLRGLVRTRTGQDAEAR